MFIITKGNKTNKLYKYNISLSECKLIIPNPYDPIKKAINPAIKLFGIKYFWKNFT